jgi:hypothetical protein
VLQIGSVQILLSFLYQIAYCDPPPKPGHEELINKPHLTESPSVWAGIHGHNFAVEMDWTCSRLRIASQRVSRRHGDFNKHPIRAYFVVVIDGCSLFPVDPLWDADCSGAVVPTAWTAWPWLHWLPSPPSTQQEEQQCFFLEIHCFTDKVAVVRTTKCSRHAAFTNCKFTIHCSPLRLQNDGRVSLVLFKLSLIRRS